MLISSGYVLSYSYRVHDNNKYELRLTSLMTQSSLKHLILIILLYKLCEVTFPSYVHSSFASYFGES